MIVKITLQNTFREYTMCACFRQEYDALDFLKEQLKSFVLASKIYTSWLYEIRRIDHLKTLEECEEYLKNTNSHDAWDDCPLKMTCDKVPNSYLMTLEGELIVHHPYQEITRMITS
jgi:hypothetical protein